MHLLNILKMHLCGCPTNTVYNTRGAQVSDLLHAYVAQISCQEGFCILKASTQTSTMRILFGPVYHTLGLQPGRKRSKKDISALWFQSMHFLFGIEGQLIAATNVVAIFRALTRSATTDDKMFLLVAVTVRALVSTAQDHL